MVVALEHLASTYADNMLYARDDGNGLRGSHVVIGGTPASTSTGGSLYLRHRGALPARAS